MWSWDGLTTRIRNFHSIELVEYFDRAKNHVLSDSDKYHANEAKMDLAITRKIMVWLDLEGSSEILHNPQIMDFIPILDNERYPLIPTCFLTLATYDNRV